jgi:hypothetical protein
MVGERRPAQIEDQNIIFKMLHSMEKKLTQGTTDITTNMHTFNSIMIIRI